MDSVDGRPARIKVPRGVPFWPGRAHAEPPRLGGLLVIPLVAAIVAVAVVLALLTRRRRQTFIGRPPVPPPGARSLAWGSVWLITRWSSVQIRPGPLRSTPTRGRTPP